MYMRLSQQMLWYRLEDLICLLVEYCRGAPRTRAWYHTALFENSILTLSLREADLTNAIGAPHRPLRVMSAPFRRPCRCGTDGGGSL